MMKRVVNHREIAKPGAPRSASREGSSNTTVRGQDKRPRGRGCHAENDKLHRVPRASATIAARTASVGDVIGCT